ncbi:MAG: GTP cyclohydrolase II [Rhodobacteraceae bacterium]|nr:GTP cyclohydrolase II [Paracoccaceae bacterium]
MVSLPNSLRPKPADRIARAVSDLRMGFPVHLSDPTGGALVLAAENIQDSQLDALREMGTPELALSDWRATTLKVAAYDGDLVRLDIPQSVSARWITSAANPADDLATPMKGPFRSIREGRADLHRAAIHLCKQAHLLPAAVLVATGAAEIDQVLTVTLEEVDQFFAQGLGFRDVVHARVPLELARNSQVHVFRAENGGDEHYAIEIGAPARDAPVLTRLHSACFTGDILGSLKCDCGPQLHAALEAMGTEGAGVLLYLNQEGRGIGLANKMRAYALQDQGFDTVEANHRLGFEDDERDFRIGARLLQKLGFDTVRLMTNNPAKVAMMESCGVAVVERVSLKVGQNALNAGYLGVKAAKSGHLL